LSISTPAALAIFGTSWIVFWKKEKKKKKEKKRKCADSPDLLFSFDKTQGVSDVDSAVSF
jgi:hypothetical protein